jgi:Fe2+ transport system protein FeoA
MGVELHHLSSLFTFLKGVTVSIYDLIMGQKAKIIAINAQSDLKHRFKSLGIWKGAAIEVRAFSLGKQNVELSINDTLVALRVHEMKMIEVEPIN